MSGIVGIYRLDDSPVDREELESMSARLAHRGLDQAGIWAERAIGFGHRMLWTTPEARQETLPDATTSPGLVITADARIDNRDDLRAALALPQPTGEITDSALILAAYEKWGERCPEFLIGDFAFAIWDRRRNLLFCARDPMGIRPFFFHASPRVFAFASEIKALFALPSVAAEIDESKVAEYLDPELRADEGATFYRDVRRLPPAHSLIAAPGHTAMTRYWRLDPMHEVRYASDREYEEAFLEVFTEAVRCRLRSAEPVGAKLSGGLDSSAIVTVARQLLSANGAGPMPTFSLVFEDPRGDERAFIEALVSEGGLEPHYVNADVRSPMQDIELIIGQADEPFWAPAASLQRVVYEAASAEGVRVLLDGLGGDQVVSYGYPLLTELTRKGRWIRTAHVVRELARVGALAPRVALWQFALKANAPPLARSAWRALRGRPESLSSAELRARFRRKRGRDRSVPLRTARAAHCLGIAEGLPGDVIDRTAAAFSVEPRYPFFDRRLVELCVALPAEQKLKRGWTRSVLRRAVAGILLDEIRWRAWKATPVTSFTHGLLARERQLLDRIIFEPAPGTLERYVDLETLRGAYRRSLELAADPASTSGFLWRDVVPIWKTVVLSLWLDSVTPAREAREPH